MPKSQANPTRAVRPSPGKRAASYVTREEWAAFCTEVRLFIEEGRGVFSEWKESLGPNATLRAEFDHLRVEVESLKRDGVLDDRKFNELKVETEAWKNRVLGGAVVLNMIVLLAAWIIERLA